MTNPTPRSANFIASPNTPPTLALIPAQVVDEGNLLTFTVVATDTNQPPQTLTFSLDPGAPEGAGINPASGVFKWIPTEAQGPGVYAVTLRVTDNGTPSLGATQTVQITVNEVNNAPVLAPILSQNISEGSTLIVTNSATDPDNAQQLLTFSLGNGAPEGMSIDPATGLITWTPTEAQGPGNYTIVVNVTDDGAPPLSDSKSFSVFVSEFNLPPEISFASNWIVWAEDLLTFTAVATDPDLPAQMKLFSIDPGGPADAHLDPATGLFTWTPSVANVGTNTMVLRVTDNGAPPASATGVLQVVVLPPLHARVSVSDHTASITFDTIAGRTYRVEYKSNLADSSWLQLGSDTLANSTSLTFQDALVDNQPRFYRIMQVQ
jgi:hypothetical protein